MVTLSFDNNLLELIFETLLSEHSRTNIRTSLLGFPLTGMAFSSNPKLRKRGVYQRELIVFYEVDNVVEPTEVRIIGYRFGRMNRIIGKNTIQNRNTIAKIFADYPDDNIRDKIY